MKKEPRDNSLYPINNKKPILSHHEPSIDNAGSVNINKPDTPNPSVTPKNEGNIPPPDDHALNADLERQPITN